MNAVDLSKEARHKAGLEPSGSPAEVIAKLHAENEAEEMRLEAEDLASVPHKDLEKMVLKAIAAGDVDREKLYNMALEVQAGLMGGQDAVRAAMVVPALTEEYPAEGELEPRRWGNPLDLMKLSSSEPQPPKFIMADWSPCGYATLFAGHGGVGKSGIALTLAVCIAAGIPFFGLPVERRRVLYLSCEDREGVLHWRLARICAFLGVSLSDLSGWLDVIDLVGHDTILYQPGRDCPAYGHLRARMIEAKTHVLFVDGISDTYNGNENARAEVKAFVNSMLALIPPDEGAVVLVGHVAKLAANTRTTEGYSGSTGWHNAVRARWYLYPESSVSEDGTAARTGGLVLELQKSNLGPTDHAMTFSWDDAAGMFTGTVKGGESHFDRKYRDREEREGIIAAFRSCPDYIPAATMGQRTAFHVLSVQPDFPESLRSGSGSKKRFWRHIEALRAMRTLTEASITRKSDRAKVRTLALDKDLQECSNAEKNIPAPMLAAPSASNAAMLAGGYRGSYACTPSGEESIDTLDDIRLEVGNEG
jgi:RecA-family ATPase